MPTWAEDIVAALQNLGGIARLRDIYDEVKRIRVEPLPDEWQASIRGIIEDNSSDSARYKGRDIFFSAKGLGRGTWGLRSYVESTPQPEDIVDAEAQRIKTETYRILRDTVLARTIKLLHQNKCQICGETITLPNGNTYSEAHHIKPLGRPHNGPDAAENILVLCPNHHVMCDYGAIELDLRKLRRHPDHAIDQQFITYHNQVIKVP